MDILGSITSCIDLAERVWDVVQSYIGANETAADLYLFNYEQNIVRLRLLHSGLRHTINRLEPRELKTFEDAATRLKGNLNKALDYLKTNTVGKRLQWAFWREKEAINRFEQIRSNMEILQGIVTLAKLTPDPKSLSLEDNPGKFNVLNPKDMNWLKNAPRAYSVTASWAPSDGTLYEAPREAVEVLVESYRPDKQSSKEQKAATQKASQIAQKLWWTCEDKSAFRSAFLPCIGFEEHRVVFLLPRNAKGLQTLGGLIRGDGATDAPTTPPIEVRYSLALQLAQAVLRVHDAGLMHCAIRGDTILFLFPDEQKDGAPIEPKDSPNLINEKNGQEAQVDIQKAAPLKRGWRDRLRVPGRLQNGNSRPQTPDGDDVSDDAASILTTNRASNAQLSTTNVTTVTTAGWYIPPGFGSVYLMHWGSLHDRGDHFSVQHRSELKNLYRHPDQQKGLPDQYNMGHDIYSVGVCLIEIGLWASFAQVKAKKLVLAEKLGLRGSGSGGEENENETWDPARVKQALVDLAAKELPQAMGAGYARTVEACLTCLDRSDSPFRLLDRQRDAKEFEGRVVSFLARVHDAMTNVR